MEEWEGKRKKRRGEKGGRKEGGGERGVREETKEGGGDRFVWPPGTSGQGVGQDSVPQLVHRKHGHRRLSDRGQSGSMEAERALEAMVEI